MLFLLFFSGRVTFASDPGEPAMAEASFRSDPVEPATAAAAAAVREQRMYACYEVRTSDVQILLVDDADEHGRGPHGGEKERRRGSVAAGLPPHRDAQRTRTEGWSL